MSGGLDRRHGCRGSTGAGGAAIRAVEALFKATGAVMSPADRADYEHTLAAVRAQTI